MNDEPDDIRQMRKLAEAAATNHFDLDWEALLQHECQPWQREAMELAFRMGFFEGIGYAGKYMNEALEGEDL